MSRQPPLFLLAFLAGLGVVAWIGTGYLTSSPLGVAVVGLIAACYLAGVFELHRYRQATASLAEAVTALAETPAQLEGWLERLQPSLRHAVRLRIEGERTALPAPALAPYLVGLLVLLGMLGTLLGMMLTLRGTGLALESTTDLDTVRTALAAPVKGLGFAFGTSIAGVASSAMLGLLSALCRRERLQAVQALDAKIATVLRPYSQAWQREESFRLLQRQTELMPALVERLQAMTDAIEQQGLVAHERQLASQDAFHARSEAAYARLAASMEQSLNTHLSESARSLGTALQPAVQATLDGLARETAALHASVSQAVQRQLDSVSSGFETNAVAVAGIWNQSLAQHRQANEDAARELRELHTRLAETLEERSTRLLDTLSAQFEAVAGRNQQAFGAAAATLETHAAKLVERVQQSHADLQSALESRDQQRLSTWAETLANVGSALSTELDKAGAQAVRSQQETCETLARTANEIAAQTQAHASATIAEISRLVQTASEAPKAAADVVAELRQKLSESMVRDTAMLEERSKLLATLETLLDAVNHASTEQRAAVDALVSTSADLLERVGNRFGAQVESETGKLGHAAAQVNAGAIEVASLGETFGAAVQSFGASNDALMDRLERIADALDKSLNRSDEQLAYYVAQAREVIDLSLLSQKQIIEDLQQHGGLRQLAAANSA